MFNDSHRLNMRPGLLADIAEVGYKLQPRYDLPIQVGIIENHHISVKWGDGLSYRTALSWSWLRNANSFAQAETCGCPWSSTTWVHCTPCCAVTCQARVATLGIGAVVLSVLADNATWSCVLSCHGVMVRSHGWWVVQSPIGSKCNHLSCTWWMEMPLTTLRPIRNLLIKKLINITSCLTSLKESPSWMSFSFYSFYSSTFSILSFYFLLSLFSSTLSTVGEPGSSAGWCSP